MKDAWNRIIDYIRISITDRCNLRCVYCMPKDGVTFLEHDKIITYEEILTICREMVKMGIRKVKITGGEPLVRKNTVWLVEELKKIPGIGSVTMTTNGVLLKDQIRDLAKAGLDAVNVSLDTLKREEFQRVTGFDCLEQVLEGIDEALSCPGLTVKLNCVPVRSEDSRENILQLAALAKDKPLHVRFIELMPIGLGQEMDGYEEESIRTMMEEVYGPMKPFQKTLGNGPCVYYSLEGFQGKIGFISAVSHKFCDQCNRVRLTSDGVLKACLQYGTGVNLKELIADGGDTETLRKAIEETIWKKPQEHQFGVKKEEIENQEQKKMFCIGG